MGPWIHVPDIDAGALKTAHGFAAPRIRVTFAGKEVDAEPLPPLETLDGAFVLVHGVAAGEAEVQLSGRGWLPFRGDIAVGSQPVTIAHQPIVARASAMLVVNWSTPSDLAALDRTLGSCDPPSPARLDLTISSCTEVRPGSGDEPQCTPIKTEPLSQQFTFGTVTVGEVPPGWYRAELRFGKLPPTTVMDVLGPLNQQPIRLQASYLQVYGSLTRGGQPLGQDARVLFPNGGVGFAPRDSDEYHAILTEPLGAEARVDIVSCRGESAFVLTDHPMFRNARFDIDIPDN